MTLTTAAAAPADHAVTAAGRIPLAARARPPRARFCESTPPELRTPLRPTTWWRAYATVLIGFAAVFAASPAVAAIAAEGIGGGRSAPAWADLGPYAVEHWLRYIQTTVLALLVFTYAAWRRGSPTRHVGVRDVGVAPAWARSSDPAQRSRWRAQAWSVFAATLDAVARMQAGTGPGMLLTAVTEELIVVGLTVTVLAAARRPTIEILAVATALKISYHLYYGWPVLLALGPAALVVAWLYLRTGRLTPIVLGHAAHNGLSAISTLAALYIAEHTP